MRLENQVGEVRRLLDEKSVGLTETTEALENAGRGAEEAENYSRGLEEQMEIERCLVCLKDLLLVGRTLGEHIHNLWEVFMRLSEADLRLKPSKCKLVQQEVEFLRYIVSGRRISTNPGK